MRCAVDGNERKPAWFGSYLRFRDLRPGESIMVQFPMVEVIEEWSVSQLTWPGNIIGEEAAQDVVKALEERLEKHFSRYEKSECSGLRLDEQPIPNSAEPWRREG